jgi:hypothetical protein
VAAWAEWAAWATWTSNPSRTVELEMGASRKVRPFFLLHCNYSSCHNGDLDSGLPTWDE